MTTDQPKLKGANSNKPVHPVVRAKVIELLDDGLDRGEVAARVGIRASTVRSVQRSETERRAKVAEKKRRERKKMEKLWDRIIKRNKEKRAR